jgi:hypothetical protein
MAKREVNEQHALDALSRAPDGLTTIQLGAVLWPGSAKTHLPAGRVVAQLKMAGCVTQRAGVVSITPEGADRLVALLEAKIPA